MVNVARFVRLRLLVLMTTLDIGDFTQSYQGFSLEVQPDSVATNVLVVYEFYNYDFGFIQIHDVSSRGYSVQISLNSS